MPLRAFGVLLLGFGGHASVQAHTIGVFKGFLDGLGEAADAHDAPFPGSQKASQAQKHVFTAFSEGFSKAKRMHRMLLRPPNQPH